MIRFLREHPSAIIAVVFFSLAAGGTSFVFQQAQREVLALRAVRAEIAGLSTRARRADALESRWETVAVEAALITGAFLDREDLPKFFEAIEATAAAAGVRETTSIAEQGERDIRFRITATGAFQDLFTFVTHLNVLPTLLFVEEVGFRNVGSESGSSEVGEAALADVLVRVPLHIENAGGDIGPEADDRSRTPEGDVRED